MSDVNRDGDSGIKSAGDRDAVAVFDALYRERPDPWGTHTRWYERRKRDLLLASLPDEHYGAAFEAGCGTGHLTSLLADRCDELTASDASAEAVALTRDRVVARRHVHVERQRLPDDWPERPFDLIVLGELLYFVDGPARERIAAAAGRSAGDDGMVVACHWRHVIAGRAVTGEEAHRHFGRALALAQAYHYEDEDFVLTGWRRAGPSIAQREGLR